MPLRIVAVGIDGSAAGADAFAWARQLAERPKTILQVVHVWETPQICTYPGSCPSPEESVRHARRVVRDAVSTMAGSQRVESVVARGSTGPTLVDVSSDADLLVVGRSGHGLVDHKSEFGEILAGATARYCVHHAQVPVAAIPPGATWTEAPQVVVGVDGSPNSLAALRWAATFLPANATIHAVRSLTPPVDEVAGTPIDVELLDPIVDEHVHELRGLVEANVPHQFTEDGRKITTHLVYGYAVDAITNPGFHCDLIVLGEHGETAATPGVLGSVSDHTLRNAAVPLIVIPSRGPDCPQI